MLTPDDLVNPKLKSGYQHVRKVGGQPSRKGSVVLYQAQHMPLSKDCGPARRTARAAAQDYCDYVNSGGVTKAPRTKRAGNHVKRDPIDDQEVQAALGVLRDHRAQKRKAAQGWVYCIGEEGHWDAVKVGYSVKPAARVGELQTGNPRKLVLLGALKGTEADEAALHQRHMDDNILLEWFRPTTKLLSEFGLEMPAAGGAGSDERSATACST